MKKKVVPNLGQEVKLKVDIVTSEDIKIYYTGKFQDFTARYIIKFKCVPKQRMTLKKGKDIFFEHRTSNPYLCQ